jgi:hypothetical protein
VTHDFDIVTVRVEHERSVVVRMIVRARARSTVRASARRQRRVIERVDERATIHPERDV